MSQQQTAQAHYTAVWIPPAGSLNSQVEIGTAGSEAEALELAKDYDAPAAGSIEIRHITATGHMLSTLQVEPDGEPEDEEQTTGELAAAADELEADLDADPDSDPEALFDPAQYETEELAIGGVDGISVAKIGLNIQGGMIWLDRGRPEDVSLVRDLHVGQTVRLLVEVTVGVPKFGYTTNKGGELDVLYRARNVKANAVVLAVNQPVDDDEPAGE